MIGRAMTSEPERQMLDILVVDDNDDDVVLLQESLRDQPAARLLGIARDGETACRRAHRRERPDDVAEIELALRRQHQAVRRALEQAHAEMLLELADQAAHRPRGHAKAIAGARKAQLAGRGHEAAKAIQRRQIVLHQDHVIRSKLKTVGD